MPGLETGSLVGRNSPMNDFCALGLSAPISFSEPKSLWEGGVHRAMGLGVPPNPGEWGEFS